MIGSRICAALTPGGGMGEREPVWVLGWVLGGVRSGVLTRMLTAILIWLSTSVWVGSNRGFCARFIPGRRGRVAVQNEIRIGGCGKPLQAGGKLLFARIKGIRVDQPR